MNWILILIAANIFLSTICIGFIIRYYYVSRAITRLCRTIDENSEIIQVKLDFFDSNDKALLEFVKEIFAQITQLQLERLPQMSTSIEEQIANELEFLAPEGENIQVKKENAGGDEFLLGDIIPKS